MRSLWIWLLRLIGRHERDPTQPEANKSLHGPITFESWISNYRKRLHQSSERNHLH
jgi:hypothetical protein